MFIKKSLQELKDIESFKLTGDYPAYINDKNKKYKFKKLANIFDFSSDGAYFLDNSQKKKFFATENKIQLLEKIKEIHNEGHFGRDRLTNYVNERIYGVSRNEIQFVIKSCVQCSCLSTFNTKQTITPIISKNPRDRYFIDMIDLRRYKKLNEDYGWILVVLDSFTKYGQAFSCKTKSTKEVCEKLDSFFLIAGAPIILHSDNGLEFKSQEMKNLCQFYDVKQVFGRPRCPWIQGQVERFNQTIKRSLSKTVLSSGEGKKWIHSLKITIKMYNSTVHETTKNIPYNLFFGITKDVRKEKNYIERLKNFNEDTNGDENVEIGETEENIICSNNDELEKKFANARENTKKAADYMVKRSKWKNDEVFFNCGDIVILKTDKNTNSALKMDPLHSNIDFSTYRVIKIKDNTVDLLNTTTNETKENICIFRIKKIY